MRRHFLTVVQFQIVLKKDAVHVKRPWAEPPTAITGRQSEEIDTLQLFTQHSLLPRERPRGEGGGPSAAYIWRWIFTASL